MGSSIFEKQGTTTIKISDLERITDAASLSTIDEATGDLIVNVPDGEGGFDTNIVSNVLYEQAVLSKTNFLHVDEDVDDVTTEDPNYTEIAMLSGAELYIGTYNFDTVIYCSSTSTNRSILIRVTLDFGLPSQIVYPIIRREFKDDTDVLGILLRGKASFTTAGNRNLKIEVTNETGGGPNPIIMVEGVQIDVTRLLATTNHFYDPANMYINV